MDDTNEPIAITILEGNAMAIASKRECVRNEVNTHRPSADRQGSSRSVEGLRFQMGSIRNKLRIPHAGGARAQGGGQSAHDTRCQPFVAAKGRPTEDTTHSKGRGRRKKLVGRR